MAEIVSRMARMDVKEAIPRLSSLEENEVNMFEKEEDSDESEVFSEFSDFIMSDDECEYIMYADAEHEKTSDSEQEEPKSKIRATYVPLHRSDPNKTGKELMKEMLSYVRTWEGDMSEMQKEAESKLDALLSSTPICEGTTEAAMNDEDEIGEGNVTKIQKEAESKLDAVLSSLTPIYEDTKEAAMNDKDEIGDDDMEELASKLQLHWDDYHDLLVFSALYGRWTLHRYQRYHQECARKGMTQFNDAKGTHFVVDKSTIRENLHVYEGRVNYYHFNFIATDDLVSKETCLFFAEVVDEGEMVLNVCRKVEPGVKTGCWFCEPEREISHPKDVCAPRIM